MRVRILFGEAHIADFGILYGLSVYSEAPFTGENRPNRAASARINSGVSVARIGSQVAQRSNISVSQLRLGFWLTQQRWFRRNPVRIEPRVRTRLCCRSIHRRLGPCGKDRDQALRGSSRLSFDYRQKDLLVRENRFPAELHARSASVPLPRTQDLNERLSVQENFNDSYFPARGAYGAA